MCDPRLRTKGAVLNRLTQSYVVVAISGTATIVAAVVAFVMLVSMQTIQEWPISDFGLHLGNDDSAGVSRATELGAPARPAAAGSSHAAAPGALPGAIPAPAGRAGRAGPEAPGEGAAHHGHQGVEGGSAIAGRGDRSGGGSTGAPTVTAPGHDSVSPSDAGSAPAVVEPTGADSGSGASAGSRSASNVGDAPSEPVDVPKGHGRGHGSAAADDSGSEHAAKSPVSSSPASTESHGSSNAHGPSKSNGSSKSNAPPSKSKSPAAKSKPASTGSVPKSTPPAAASENAASGEGPGKALGSQSSGGPPGLK